MIGLKRGTVALYAHQTQWEVEAKRTIAELWSILGDVAQDIQHVGSTAVPAICAKPIIDIAVAVGSFDEVLRLEPRLRERGYYYRPQAQLGDQLLFARGSLYDGSGDMQTHFIHVVRAGSEDMINYVCFRDHLNSTPSAARAYEALKLSLAEQAPVDSGREKYLAGKHDFIVQTLRRARARVYLGRVVEVTIDRPMGSAHPEHPQLVYPVNYGYIPHTQGGDGEALDVYVLGVDAPVSECRVRIVGIVHRADDAEDKLIAAPVGAALTAEEAASRVHFQEKFFDSSVEMLSEL